MQEKLKLSNKITFGVCELGASSVLIIISAWLMNYLTDYAGLAAGLTGLVVMIGKIFDAVIDPTIGYVSDNTHTKWGRRKPFIFIGGILALISLVFLFSIPPFNSQIAIFIWALIGICLVAFSFSTITIPYGSLTPELTRDSIEQNSLNGWRMAFSIIGTLLGASMFFTMATKFGERTGVTRLGFTIAAAFFGIITMILAFVTSVSVKEKYSNTARLKENILQSIFFSIKNKPYILILIPWFLNMTAVTVLSGTQVYFFKYIYNNENLAPLSMLVLMGTAAIFIPIWVQISKIISKKITYSIGLLIIVVCNILIFLIGHTAGIPTMMIFMFIAGIGLSATYFTPWAMIPETIEFDAIKTKERREGTYYGVWNFFAQFGQAFGFFIMGGILQAFGYAIGVNIQSSGSTFGIRLLMGPVPAALFIIAAIIVLFYPITTKSYNEMIGNKS